MIILRGDRRPLTFKDTSFDRSPIWGMLLSDKSRCCSAVQLLICSMVYYKKSITSVRALKIENQNRSLILCSWVPHLLLSLDAQQRSWARQRGKGRAKFRKKQAFKDTKQFIPSQVFIAQRNFNGIKLRAEKRIHKFRMKPHSLLNPGSMVKGGPESRQCLLGIMGPWHSWAHSSRGHDLHKSKPVSSLALREKASEPHPRGPTDS